jgi:hypothetical protein
MTAAAHQRRRRPRVSLLLVLLSVAGLLPACGDSPTKPSPPPDSPPNTPPVIGSLTVDRERTEVGRDVRISATVTDAETPVTSLAYEWTSAVGTFTGTGAEVMWRASATATTPAAIELTLTVVERYTAIVGGVSRSLENRTTKTASIRVNNSPRETAELGVRFLTDFANSRIPAAVAVREFTDSCSGKQDELRDVEHNRETFDIVGFELGTPDVELNSRLTSATIEIPCDFTSIRLSTGETEQATGTCALTAVYEQFRWWLCTSRFFGTTSSGRLFMR